MNTNKFEIASATNAAGGTVLFALRGNSSGYEDRLVEVDRSGNVGAEYRLRDGLKLIGEVRKLANGNVLFLKSTLPSPDGPIHRIVYAIS